MTIEKHQSPPMRGKSPEKALSFLKEIEMKEIEKESADEFFIYFLTVFLYQYNHKDSRILNTYNNYAKGTGKFSFLGSNEKKFLEAIEVVLADLDKTAEQNSLKERLVSGYYNLNKKIN